MPKIKYTIEKSGPKRLEISWKGNWQEFTIRLDGSIIGSIADHEQLKEGQEFLLEDGSCLKIQLQNRSIFSYPQISKDGQLLHPSGLDPAKRLGNAYKLIFVIGGLNLAIGIILLFRIGLINSSAVSLRSIVAGVVFLLLGFFVMRKSTIALTIAVVILAINVILAFIFPPDLTKFIFIVAVIFRILILLAISQGYGAIKALKQNQPYSSGEK